MGILDLTSDLSKNAGINLSVHGERHGGTEPGGLPVHPDGHSILDNSAGDNLSEHGGRHGGTSNETPSRPSHSPNHSSLDNGVGNSSNAQTFDDGHGYTVTGNKYWTRPNASALAQMLESVGGTYTPTGEGVQTGPVNYFSGISGEWGAGTSPLGFTFGFTDKNSSELTRGTEQVITLPTSYPKTRSVFNHYTIPAFESSIYYDADTDMAAPSHNPGTIITRQMGRTTPPPGLSATHAAINTSFPEGQPTFHISKQHGFTGEYGVQDRESGTYILNTPETVPSAPLLFAGLFGLNKGSRFSDLADPAQLKYPSADIFGTSYSEMTSLGSNITIPETSLDKFQQYTGEDTFTNYFARRSRYDKTTFDTLSIGNYSSEFQLGKAKENSPEFDNEGFKKSLAYAGKNREGDGQLGWETSISTITKGPKSNLAKLHKDGTDNVDSLEDYYGRGFKKDNNLAYRNDNVIGFDQPYFLKEIGDRWGIDAMGDTDIGVVRGGLNTAIARTIADEIRIAKFILTPKGIVFALKQAVFQRFNTRAETRLWNPISLFTSVIPAIHGQRHVDQTRPQFAPTAPADILKDPAK